MFIICSKPEVTIFQYKRLWGGYAANREIIDSKYVAFNNPVNLDFCSVIEKKESEFEESFFIEFKGVEVSWTFSTRKDRDIEYNWILSKLSKEFS